VSHYLRAGLITNLCSSYATSPVSGCSANFRETKAITSASAGAKTDPSLAKLETALQDAKASTGKGKVIPGASPLVALQELTDPTIAGERNAGLANIRSGAARGAGANGVSSGQSAAMDYLLGGGGR